MTEQPKREQIAAWLKQQMIDGQLRAGQQLPSIRDIAADPRWHAGHNVVQQAIRQLRTEGLVRTVPGGGVFATPERMVWGPYQEIRGDHAPRGERIEMRAAAIITTPDYVSDKIHTAQVVRREWITYGLSSPVANMLSVSWCPAWAAAAVPDLLHLRPLPHPGGAAPMIAAAHSEPLTRGWCSWEARLPLDDGREIPLLHLDRGAYVNGTVITWDIGDGEDQQTVEYREFVVGPNRVVEVELVP